MEYCKLQRPLKYIFEIHLDLHPSTRFIFAESALFPPQECILKLCYVALVSVEVLPRQVILS